MSMLVKQGKCGYREEPAVVPGSGPAHVITWWDRGAVTVDAATTEGALPRYSVVLARAFFGESPDRRGDAWRADRFLRLFGCRMGL
ncbi:hypothetical protein [Actinopolyspora xinjiangensis]|uniref:hypothetical protein n=1 Tax=Actinopolyspora xinjiangensis TaxID=405564 RepID=UPI001113C389|nr:hypothetical protein [Actinopolyspora xinjiangensis]